METLENTLPPNEIKPTWTIALILWWAWMWRTTLVVIVGGAVLGFCVGIVSVLLSFDGKTASVVSSILGMSVGVFFSVYFMKWMLNKKFKKFRIVLQQIDK
jgi:ABC-type uncharacterized transport system permease subunit